MTLQTAPSLDDPKEVSIFGVQTGFERIDLMVGFGAPLAVFMIGLLATLPIYVTIPAVVLTAMISLSLMYVTPSYLNISEYVTSIRYYLRRRGTVDNTVKAAVPDDESGYLSNYKLEESTREMVEAKKFYPESNIIQRTDGTMAGALRINPPNRDFDDNEVFIRIGQKIKEQLNNNVDFDFQFYVTTRPFPIDDFISELEGRLDDQDIQDRPIMEAILRETVDTRPETLKERGTELPHYYLITTASPNEISVNSTGTDSPVDRLIDIPVIGLFAEIISNVQDDAEEYEKEARLVERVHERLQILDTSIVQPVDDLSSDVVGVVEWAELLETLWNGTDNTAPIVRQHGVSRGPADVPDVTEDIETSDEGDAGEPEEPAVKVID